MIKQLHFVGQSDQGILAQALFGSSGCFEKTAGAPPFSDWETGEELRKAVGGITKKDREQACYVLVNALGAGEFYGSNINADWFPWNSLCHEGDDYGYRTFLNANAFQHHKNKDPARAFGKPLFSILNPMMKRVELIIRLDREKARAEGADGIITRIDMGEFPDVSMGCKVPWDECSICSAHSKTKDDYCLHMRPPEELRYLYGPNRILVDGRKIFVKNIYPRFFDISFVFIGADKTAKVMAKLASAQFERNELSADAGHRFYIDLGHTKTASALPACPDRSCAECDRNCGGMAKMASAFGKTAAHNKVSEIIKDIPAGTFSMRRLPELEQSEPTITRPHLDELAKLPLPGVLGASTVMGMILKPQEFQYLALKRMGEDDLLEQLERKNEVFPSVSEGFMSVDITLEAGDEAGDGIKKAMEILSSYVSERGAFGQPFSIRVHLHRDTPKLPLPMQSAIGHPLLNKLGAAYNGYRREVMTKLSKATEVLQRDPRLREVVLGEGLGNMMMKTSSSSPLLTLDSVVYMMGAYLEDRRLLHTTAVEAVDHVWLS
jgi:hypothetical protein